MKTKSAYSRKSEIQKGKEEEREKKKKNHRKQKIENVSDDFLISINKAADNLLIFMLQLKGNRRWDEKIAGERFSFLKDQYFKTTGKPLEM